MAITLILWRPLSAFLMLYGSPYIEYVKIPFPESVKDNFFIINTKSCSCVIIKSPQVIDTQSVVERVGIGSNED